MDIADTRGKPFFGLLGRKLGHSYSAEIHRLLGFADYRLTELEPEELEGFFAKTDFGCVNVTMPYKKSAALLCDALSPEAEATGSVNTVIGKSGKNTGYNTDIAGFLYTAKSSGISFGGKKVLIFGHGGAAAACRYACETEGASEILNVSRTGETERGNVSLHTDAQIIINATPVGMYPDLRGCVTDLTLFKSAEGVIDLCYNPCRTALLESAENLGIPNAGGLFMLVAQAAEAHRLYDGGDINDAAVRETASRIRNSKTNIVIIGMPGVGKTTAGQALAKALGRPFTDTDALIERATGMSPADIITGKGEAFFRAVEWGAMTYAASLTGSVIVTGGGAVTVPDGMECLRRNGTVFYLTGSILTVNNRPLSADTASLAAVREPLYRKYADFTLSRAGTPELTAERISELFNENTCH